MYNIETFVCSQKRFVDSLGKLLREDSELPTGAFTSKHLHRTLTHREKQKLKTEQDV
jgi:hypothetical protein